MRHFIFFLAFTATASAIEVKRIAGHRLFAANGTEFVSDQPVRFAVVGNTRGGHPVLDKGREGHGEVTRDVVGDITAAALTGGPSFVVLTGDNVRSSSPSEWQDLDARFVGLLDGETPPPSPIKRIPAIALAGDREGSGDEAYQGLEASFPGTGAAIGYGRVATWSSFDVVTQGSRWRFIVLDCAKESLGPRWNEQLAWIPTAVAGQYAGLLIFVHDPSVNLGGKRTNSAETAELLGAIDHATGMLAVKAVFFAGPNASQALLPEGHFGPLHVGTGGGGAPAAELYRQGPDAAGTQQRLVPGFDTALLDGMRQWKGPTPISNRSRERAEASGAFQGTDGVFDARPYPTYGWWLTEIEQATVRVTFRMHQPDGTFKDTWSAQYERATGWVSR